MIPSDPRTWSDFRNPKQYGFEKVDCDTTLETAWSSGAAALAFTALWLAFEIYLHSPAHAARYGHPYLPMSLGPLILPGVIAGSMMLFALRLLTDNFYLVDAANHTVYYHFWFLFFRRVTLLLGAQEIRSVSTESRQRWGRYKVWWEQRVVVLSADARVVPMSDWRRDGVYECNQLGSALTKKLGCQWTPAPEDVDAATAVESGHTTRYLPLYPGWGSGNPWRLASVGAGLALFVVFYLFGWVR